MARELASVVEATVMALADPVRCCYAPAHERWEDGGEQHRVFRYRTTTQDDRR